MKLIRFETWIIFFGYIFWLILTKGIDLKTYPGMFLAVGLCFLLFFNKKLFFAFDWVVCGVPVLWRSFFCVYLYTHGWQEVSWTQTLLILLAGNSSLVCLNKNNYSSHKSRYWIIPFIFLFEYFSFGNLFLLGLLCWVKPDSSKSAELKAGHGMSLLLEGALYSLLFGSLVFLLLNNSIWLSPPEHIPFLFVSIGTLVATYLPPKRIKINMNVVQALLLFSLLITIFFYLPALNVPLRFLAGLCLGHFLINRRLNGPFWLLGLCFGYLFAQREEAMFLLLGLILWAMILSTKKLFRKQQS